MREVLSDLKIDCEKVINNLVNAGCDDAWSIIKLNNMIQDIDDALELNGVKCRTCDGSGSIEDVNDIDAEELMDSFDDAMNDLLPKNEGE